MVSEQESAEGQVHALVASSGWSPFEDSLRTYLRLVDKVRSDANWSEAQRGPASGGSFGRFVIERELGRGGGGVVLLAFDPVLRRKVALKLPGPEAVGSLSSRGRFLTEARTVATLRHENIVVIHEAGEFGSIPYIVMEYCEAGSLADWLKARPRDRPLPSRWAARLVARVADGVQHAHDLGIFHRDLKPGNILIEVSGRDPEADAEAWEASRGRPADPDGPPEFIPKVGDFGLAKDRDADDPDRERTVQGVPLGTLPYMAPEAARGEGSAIGPRTDVYGLGVILFELLTGRRPFGGPVQADVLEQIQREEPPSPRRLRNDLPVDLETICLKCLEKDPRERFATAGELADGLRRFLDGKPIGRRPGLPWRRLASRARRRPVRSAIIGLAVATALVFGVAGLILRESRRRGDVDVRLTQLESADLASLPDLVAGLDPTDPRVAGRLHRLYAEGIPSRKLAAALVLAAIRPECGDHAYEGLLRAGPREIGPLARMLRDRIEDLPARLAADADRPPPRGVPHDEAEAHDRRRAVAACALVLLGPDDRGWSLLRFAPEPQARSFLIHLLGPAGVDPSSVADRLDSEADPSVRRALIQSLGEFPDASWTASVRDRVRSRALDLYEHDPDPGVHGSAKWLLIRWNHADSLQEADARLAQSPPSEDRRWRVSPKGLTFVTIDDPSTGRTFEVADAEVSKELFLSFRPRHKYNAKVSTDPGCPINCVDSCDAAEFANWLTLEEGIGRDHLAYRRGTEPPFVPVDGQLDRLGYRLLTDREFELACRAGVVSSRYHGDSNELLAKYARYNVSFNLRMFPSARLKPNDFGLFDTLGNAFEICLSTAPGLDANNQAALCGGCYFGSEFSIECSAKLDRKATHVIGSSHNGFRVARTVRAR